MVTLTIIITLLAIGIGLAIGIIAILGTIFFGVAGIIFDILIGILPFLLVYGVYKLIKRRSNG